MILVTGATGLVGVHLIKSLLDGKQKVRALYRSDHALNKAKRVFELHGVSWDLVRKRVEWVKADLLNVFELNLVFNQISQVYHCAAMVSFAKKDKEQLLKVNIEGTANIVNLCLHNKVLKLCYVSSTAAVGKQKKSSDLITEANDWQNDGSYSNYSISKYFAELEVWRGSEEGLDVVVVNPSIIIGASDWEQSSSSLFTKVWKGLKFYTKGINGFVAVNDVVKACMLLMASDIKNERFLVVGENLSFEAMFGLIAKALGVKPAHIEVKPWMAAIIWRIEALRTFLFGGAPIITKEAAKSALSVAKYDSSKIKEALGFHFTPLDEAIKQTARLFLKDKQV